MGVVYQTISQGGVVLPEFVLVAWQPQDYDKTCVDFTHCILDRFLFALFPVCLLS